MDAHVDARLLAARPISDGERLPHRRCGLDRVARTFESDEERVPDDFDDLTSLGERAPEQSIVLVHTAA